MPIFDQGYQHWTGQLAGHSKSPQAIARQGVRTGKKGIVTRIVLLVAWLPPVVFILFLCIWGLVERKAESVASITQFLSLLLPQLATDPKVYRVEIWTICFHTFLWIELWFSLILILLVGPNLVSQDLRFNALPLYFSRPILRLDYFLGKFGVIAMFLARMLLLPCLIAYVMGLIFSLDITILRDTYRLLLGSLAYGLIIICSAGVLVLALSTLSRNSRYVAMFWLGIFFVSGAMSFVVNAMAYEQRRHTFFNSANLPNDTRRRETMSRFERQRQDRTWIEAWQKARNEFDAHELTIARSNWRPIISYTANLTRLEGQLLGTNASWEKISLMLPPASRTSFLRGSLGDQYPWQWSACVLVGLFGISAWILNFRIKSLDRLK